MDKLTCIAFIMYQSSENQHVRDLAIQLLNGDISIRELKKDSLTCTLVGKAELTAKKHKPNRMELQKFAEEFLMVEV